MARDASSPSFSPQPPPQDSPTSSPKLVSSLSAPFQNLAIADDIHQQNHITSSDHDIIPQDSTPRLEQQAYTWNEKNMFNKRVLSESAKDEANGEY